MGYSPWLSAFTALFEITAAFWVLRGAGRREILRPIALTLVLLAGYQILEIFVCNSTGNPQLLLSRIAFFDVTWLPPVSLVLIQRLLSQPPRWLKPYANIALGLAGIFSLWILIDTRFVTGTICHFMYARYWHIEPHVHAYGAFYEVTQMSMIFLPAVFLPRLENARERSQLSDLMIGALLFIVPSLFLGTVMPQKFEMAMPSIMCHFALFYAIFLVRIARRERLA